MKVRLFHIPSASTIMLDVESAAFPHVLNIACLKTDGCLDGLDPCQLCPWYYNDINPPIRAEYIVGRIK